MASDGGGGLIKNSSSPDDSLSSIMHTFSLCLRGGGGGWSGWSIVEEGDLQTTTLQII